MEKVIGIDLGTGNSCVAVMEGGKPTVIANSEGSRTTPSVVYIDGDTREVGGGAKRRMTMKPKNTISFIKRFMGANYDDKDVQTMLSQISYEVVKKNNKPYIKIDGREYSPEEISSYTLAKMKKTAEEYYGEDVKKAIITVPAWFNDAQRQATKLAGELAGLEVLRIINEPTAAILSSNIKLKENEDRNIAVADVGAGTTDISVANLSMIDGQLVVEIKASYGNVFLGGQNYDNAIVEWMNDEFKKDHPGVDLKKDPMAFSRLQEAAEKAKCELSNTSMTEINLPYITVIDNIPQHLTLSLSRARFEQMTEKLTADVVECTRTAIEKAGLKPADVSEILLVGGSTRMVSIQDALTKAFNLPLDKSANPDEAVALGAVIQANIMTGGSSDKDLLLLDVTPLAFGIETEGGVFTKLIEGNTTIPTSKKQIFTTAVDNQMAVQISVYCGERTLAKDNKLIGNFELGGIMPARRGVPQIEVSFDLDANGILKVSAKDLGTGKENSIKITGSNNLSQEEIDRIKAEAEQFKAQDEKMKAKIDALNKAESFAYQMKSMVEDKDMQDKFTEEQKNYITKHADEILDVIKDKDDVKAESLAKELEKYVQGISANLYGQQPTNESADAQSSGSSSSSSDKKDEAQDVDFEEID
jgi:molecular chaperone DnaK